MNCINLKMSDVEDLDEDEYRKKKTNLTKVHTYSRTSIKEANDHLQEMFERVLKLERVLESERNQFYLRKSKMESIIKEKDFELEGLRELNKDLTKNQNGLQILVSNLEQELNSLLDEKKKHEAKINKLYDDFKEIYKK